MDKEICCDPSKLALTDENIKPIKIEPTFGMFNCIPSSSESITQYIQKETWIIGETQTPIGIVPQVSSQLTLNDTLGSWKARWGIKRMNHKVNPGLYALGKPDQEFLS